MTAFDLAQRAFDNRTPDEGDQPCPSCRGAKGFRDPQGDWNECDSCKRIEEDDE